MESSSHSRILFPWEQPEKYENFVQEELRAIPSLRSAAFDDLSEHPSASEEGGAKRKRTFEVTEKKKLSVDGIHISLDEYERIIIHGDLLLDGICCTAESTPRVRNGKVLVISKKLVLSGIGIHMYGLEVVDGDVRMDGILCKIDRSVSVHGVVKKNGLGCGFR